jgi:prepilin-type N-terminal cleavage/methylation domain-containing protein
LSLPGDTDPHVPPPVRVAGAKRGAARAVGTGDRKSELRTGECGYTLIELVVVMAVSVIVVGGPMAFIVLSLTQQNAASSRSAAAAQEEVGLARLTRDLRQVVPATTTSFTWSSSSASASFTVPQPGTEGGSTQSVTWSCSFGAAGSCTRQVGAGTQVKELSNVESVSFAPVDASGNALGGSTSPYSATNPAYVGLTVKVLDVSQLDNAVSPSRPAPGVSNWITLQDGVDLRNNSL